MIQCDVKCVSELDDFMSKSIDIEDKALSYRECPMPEDAIEVFTLRPGPRRRAAVQPKDAEEEGLQAGFDSLFGGGIAAAENLVQQEAD